jgi:FkbM family methyltransferase
MPVVKPLKETLQIGARRTLRIPHEGDFRVIPRLGLGPHCSFVDIGGNYGQSISSTLTVYPGARITSFEPNPSLAERIRRRFIGAPNISVYSYALGDEPGLLKLYIPVYRGYVYDALASLDRAAASSWLSSAQVYFFDPRRLEIREIDVPVVRLDDVGVSPDFMKIDVQGWGAHVLRGALETVGTHKPFILMENVDERSEAMSILRPLGYQRFQYAKGQLIEGMDTATNSLLVPPERIVDMDGTLFPRVPSTAFQGSRSGVA